MSISNFFGQKVKLYRLSQNLSQEELAEKSGLHRTYIGSIERGERNITLKNAENIAKALEQPLYQFFVDYDL